MSRSYKKSPGGGVTNASKSGAQKKFKRQEHKAERRTIRSSLTTQKEVLPHPKEYGNEWGSPRDGKTYWTESKDSEYYNLFLKFMRK